MDGPDHEPLSARANADHRPLPAWHPIALIALYLLVAAVGIALRAHGTPASIAANTGGRIVRVYLPLAVVQLGLAFYVCRVGRAENAFWSLFGARWTRARRAVEDVAVAVAAWGLLTAIEVAWTRWSASPPSAATVAMLPATLHERIVWTVVAVIVGTSEEIVFRGYLQRQFEAWTRRPGIALVLQALLFGLAHAEQGMAAAMRAGLYGLGFGMLARWRRSLAPGIVCHVWTDLASGWLRI